MPARRKRHRELVLDGSWLRRRHAAFLADEPLFGDAELDEIQLRFQAAEEDGDEAAAHTAALEYQKAVQRRYRGEPADLNPASVLLFKQELWEAMVEDRRRDAEGKLDVGAEVERVYALCQAAARKHRVDEEAVLDYMRRQLNAMAEPTWSAV